MSLKFVFGPSGSGKSYQLYDYVIRESVKFPDRQYIVLVPEQFTMQTQKDLVMQHPNHGIMNIDVLRSPVTPFSPFPIVLQQQ